MTATDAEFGAMLSEFADRLELLWNEYERQGPGQVDYGLFAPLEPLAERLIAALETRLPVELGNAEISAAVNQAIDLARRCATLPQGLCFVSGEAGLVPRRDQVEAFAAVRGAIRAAAE